jgi:hypothetical protein
VKEKARDSHEARFFHAFVDKIEAYMRSDYVTENENNEQLTSLHPLDLCNVMFRLSHLHGDYASTKRLVSGLTKLIKGSLAQQIPMTLGGSHLVKCVHGLHRLDSTDPGTKALVDVFGRLVGSIY